MYTEEGKKYMKCYMKCYMKADDSPQEHIKGTTLETSKNTAVAESESKGYEAARKFQARFPKAFEVLGR